MASRFVAGRSARERNRQSHTQCTLANTLLKSHSDAKQLVGRSEVTEVGGLRAEARRDRRRSEGRWVGRSVESRGNSTTGPCRA
eukprot:366255-Prorocentrum_minimum.AAC.1